jgi:arginine decarboxylase-like protein
VVLGGCCLGEVFSVAEATLITNGFKDQKFIKISLIEVQNSFF